MTRPLEGVLVVSVEQAVAVPLATRKMADAGARVIKVERPGGDFARGYDRVVDGGSAYFVWLNRGKESVVIDLKDPDGAALLRRMVSRADVFVQNLAPGAAARAGFGSEDLRNAHPRLITCDVSGYGERGPYAEMKAYDSLVQGEAGLHAVTGTPESPARVGISVCDIAAGMHVYTGVLEALRVRDRSGEGAALEVSLFSAIADWMSVPYLHQVYGGRAPERTGLRHPSIAPYGPFDSRDGDTVLVAVQNEREWVRLCERVLDRPELAIDPRFTDNPGRVEHRNALVAELQDAMGRLSTDELGGRLSEASIAFGRVRSVEDFAAHPQLALTEIETPNGRVRVPGDPVAWREREGDRGAEKEEPVRVPDLDADGAALRTEFGS
ncbi:MAG: CaiB/BaiF CoA-transferase family protein [Gemmatimonadota bacterium]|nr:CaiB/BaiF CoA-transferase family protein [Gemmatimonadota bacterium]